MAPWVTMTDTPDLLVLERASADKQTHLSMYLNRLTGLWDVEVQRLMLREGVRMRKNLSTKNDAEIALFDMLLNLPAPCWTFGQLVGTPRGLHDILDETICTTHPKYDVEWEFHPDYGLLRDATGVTIRSAYDPTINWTVEAREFPADATWDDFAKVVRAAVTDMLADAAEEEE